MSSDKPAIFAMAVQLLGNCPFRSEYHPAIRDVLSLAIQDPSTMHSTHLRFCEVLEIAAHTVIFLRSRNLLIGEVEPVHLLAVLRADPLNPSQKLEVVAAEGCYE